MSPGLGDTLARAADYAHAQHHSAVELEHLLLALTEDDDAAQVLAASQVDMALLKADVSQYLGGLHGQQAPDVSGQFGLAPDLKRILEAAAAAASQGRRREINGAIVLAAIVGDGRSSAAGMLRAQGLTFEEAIKALQRALATTPAPGKSAPVPPVPAIDTEDVLATARARVQTRAAPGLGAPSLGATSVSAPGLTTTRAEPPREPKADAWPPDVRPSQLPAEPVYEDAPAAVEFEAGIHDHAPGYDPDHAQGYEPSFEVSSSPGAPGWHQEAPNAASLQPAPQPPPLQPPPLPAAASRPRAAPQPGSRWPAPVAPAWRETSAEPAPLPPANGPPALPQLFPSQAPGPVPPPLPPDPYGYNADLAAPHQDAAWPQPDPYADPGPPAGAVDYGSPWPEPPTHDPHFGPYAGPAATPAAAPGLAKPARKRKPAERATAGQMVETIPRKMRAHVPSAVEVRLAKADFQMLADGLQADDVRRHAVLVTPAMSVRLLAPDGGFIIAAASPETQWLASKLGLIETDFASWRWSVTPLKAGRRRLQLVVSARTSVPDGTAADTTLPDQIIDVRVATNYGRATMKLAGWAAVAIAGGVFAKFGGALYDPAIAAVLAALK